MVRPRIIIGIPSEVTQVEKRAVKDSALKAKASEVYLVDQAMAAAIGAGLPITEPSGNMVVDIGGGTTDIAVISLAGIVYSKSVRVAGNEMDEAIIQYIKKKYNLLIGERTAEQIKLEIGSAFPLDEPITMEIKGRDLIEGIPKTLTITDAEIREALAEPISIIVNAVRVALERTPPELSADIVDRGIVLTGGGSLLKNLDKLLREETGLPVSVAEDPLSLGGAGHGQDALGLRPAAQDQPGLARRPWTVGRRTSNGAGPGRRAGAACCWPGWCSPTWSPSASRWTAAAAPRCSTRPSSPSSRRCRAASSAGVRGVARRVVVLRRPARRARGEPAAAASRLREAGDAAAGTAAGRAEAARLRELLELRQILPLETLVAQVIARDGVPWFRTLTINKGSTARRRPERARDQPHRRRGPRDPRGATRPRRCSCCSTSRAAWACASSAAASPASSRARCAAVRGARRAPATC